MYFRVLPVSEGDAFLLSSSRGSFLVDGGRKGTGFAQMLRMRGTRKLRAAAITHFDPVHAGGVLSLLEERFPMTECWIPAVLADACRLALGLHCGLDEWDSCLRNAMPMPAMDRVRAGQEPAGIREVLLAGGGVLGRLALDCALQMDNKPGKHCEAVREELWSSRGGALTDANVEKSLVTLLQSEFCALGVNLLNMSGESAEARMVALAGLLLDNTAAGRGMKLGQTLSLMARIAVQLASFSGRIRFFASFDERMDHLVPHSRMRCLNGLEVSPRTQVNQSSPGNLVSRVMDGADDRNCLVFRYGEAGGAVLFCSDSSMPFLGPQNRLELDRPTIITAPRHGSTACDRVYPLIVAENPQQNVWVRSFINGQRKCSQWFINMPRSFCVNCLGGLVQEVAVRSEKGNWLVLSGNSC